MTVPRIALLGLLAGAAMALPAAAGPPRIAIDRPSIQPAAAGQFETWAFATIVNDGPADALVAVRSPDAQSTVLRAATLTDAGRKMRSVGAIPVPAKGTVTLSADTYFVAFIAARHAYQSGATITATFTFASGAQVPVTLRVSGAEGDPADAGN